MVEIFSVERFVHFVALKVYTIDMCILNLQHCAASVEGGERPIRCQSGYTVRPWCPTKTPSSSWAAKQSIPRRAFGWTVFTGENLMSSVGVNPVVPTHDWIHVPHCRYEASTDSWIPMEATLKVPAQNVIAMIVDRAIFPPCGTEVPSTIGGDGTSTFESTEGTTEFLTTDIGAVTTETDLMSTDADVRTTDMSSTIQSSENEQLLMIVGGFDIEGPANGNKVGLVSLDADFPVPECLLSLNDFPKFLLDGCSATLTPGDLPHVCTGLDGYEGPFDKCYRYASGSDSWLEWGTLSEARHRAGCSYSDEHGLVITGGQLLSGPYTDLVESTQNGQAITLLEELPESKQYSCVVALQGGNLFCAGGSYAYPSTEVSGKTHVFRMDNPENSKWTEVADMITPTEGHVCGAIAAQDGSQEVVAAGGKSDIASPTYAVQIYSVNDDMWRMADPLPYAIDGATSVPYEDSFLLLGGITTGGYTDGIFMYVPQTDSWTNLYPLKMPRAAFGVTAMMVDRDIFPECESITTTEANMVSTGAPLSDMLILVIRGEDPYTYISDIELVSPYPSSNPLPECLVDLKLFTFGNIEGSVGAAVAPDGLPLMCGGTIWECDGESGCSGQVMDKCWVYDPLEDGWRETAGTMAGAKYEHAADYINSFGLAMAGVTYPLEVTRDGGLSFVELAKYPESDLFLGGDSGCLVVIDDQTLFLAGGYQTYSGSDGAFLYDASSDSWTAMPSMRVGRKYHSCGIDSTKEEIVVAGGVNDAFPLSSVEIFTVATMSWRDGNSLPFALAGSYATRFGDTFVLTGGYTYFLSDLSDSLIMYDTTSGTWVEMEGKLKTPRRSHVAIAVKKSIFPEC